MYCYEFVKKIRWSKVLAAAAVYTIVAFVVHQIEVMLTMNYYLMPEYFGVWSKVMMPGAGPPPASFMVYSLVFTYIAGVVVGALYDFIKDLLPKKFWPRVLNFTDLVISLMIVFFTLPVYLLFNVPFGLSVGWLASSLMIVFLGSAVFVKMIK